MSPMFLFYLLVMNMHLVTGQIEKSSLTFVIDDTSSMQHDINQVKDSVYDIFDSVKKSADSPIEDFILVTFNDQPNQTNFLTKTKDRKIFKSKLAKIQAHGGGNCPESSLSGIKRGLEESRHGSFLYVFTDDVADESHTVLDEVQNLAIRKATQVVFILTRSEFCGEIETKSNYHYYIDLAKATSGSVYLMDKQGVKEILKEVSERIKTRKIQIVSENLPPGYGNNVTIPIDADLKDAMLTAIGTNPEIRNITAPDGSTANSTTIVDLPGVHIKKVSSPMVGNYTAKVGSETETDFKAVATTAINFKYGFSPLEPNTMADTVSMPIQDVESHISLQIFSNETFFPSKIILKDDSNKLIDNIPLKLHDAKENIYITDKVLPPEGLFKIVVFGYHEKSKSNITRDSPTYIEVQKNFETPKDMSPTMEIDKGNSIKAMYNDTLKLLCKVEAFPKPDIIWKDEDDNILPTKVLAYNLPYSYMAELLIYKVTMNKTFKCSATNKIGDISRYIKVETERTQYLDILEEPKDTNIVYKNSGQIYCKVKAMPPATIKWFKNKLLVRSDEFVDISDAGDVLTIKQMIPHLVGDYSCAATNGLESIHIRFKLSLTGTEPSTSIMGKSKVNAEYNKPLFLRCQVKGYPKPKILWIDEKTGEEIRSAPVAVPASYDYGQEMQMEKVTKNATYKCVAENDNGKHSSAVTVVTIQKVHFSVIEAPKDTIIKYKEEGEIFCIIDAYPSASIQWKFKGKAITNSDHYAISLDGSSLKVRNMQPYLRGTYSCIVDHKDTHSRKNLKFKLRIGGTVQPEIDKSAKDIIKIKEGLPVNIDCRIIKGTPPPTIIWEFQQDDDVKFRKIETPSSRVYLERVTRYDSGAYRCIASNVKGNDDHVIHVIVEFPPTIEETKKQLDSKEGDKTMLRCIVHGYPPPTVVWSRNGAHITGSSGDYEIFRDYSLRFSASLSNNGKFTCTATNEHGTAKIETQVDYYKEIEFEIPEATNISTFVGEIEKIECKAYGYPTPTITWLFQSSEAKPSEELEIIKPEKSGPYEFQLRIRNTNQDGHYTCLANNTKSIKKITYAVHVKEPAHIIRETDSYKPIKAVKGDFVRIPCRAAGKPKPSVTWIKNGYNIPTGYDSYSLDTDGALLIENITEAGDFTCEANNGLSAPARECFEVHLEDYPRPTKENIIYSLEFGKPAIVECPIPHEPVDLLRWYKNRKQTVTGKLKFVRVSYSDAGVYICRVTNRLTFKSESQSVQINIK